jgi:hypothetical protein
VEEVDPKLNEDGRGLRDVLPGSMGAFDYVSPRLAED